MKNFETLEVGKTYKNRRGDLVKIVEYEKGQLYQFVGDNNQYYIPSGNYWQSLKESGHDLIELIEDVPTLAPNGQDAKPLTICEIDAKIAELQELRKELDKSVEVDDTWFDFRIQVRNAGEYSYKGFYLSRDYNWEVIKENNNDLVLVPTKK